MDCHRIPLPFSNGRSSKTRKAFVRAGRSTRISRVRPIGTQNDRDPPVGSRGGVFDDTEEDRKARKQ